MRGDRRSIVAPREGDSERGRDGIVNLSRAARFEPREIDAPDRAQQAHVTASHSTTARVRSRRW